MQSRRNAFTLIELLVVVAIVAILASLLLPVLARVKAQGQGISCLSNVRQLSLAWLMYADDFRDILPYNLGTAEIRQKAAQGSYQSWTSAVMNWDDDTDNTNTVLLTRGGIGPYTGSAARIYRCPSDWALSAKQIGQGWSSRVRSMSMNAMVGDAGEFTRSGTNVNNPHYAQFFKLTQIPDPSRIFVFIEEHPDSINDGYFINKFYPRKWLDLPASWHRGAANLTFADGHAEMHRWRFALTQPPPRPEEAHLPITIPTSDSADFSWLMERTSLDDD